MQNASPPSVLTPPVEWWKLDDIEGQITSGELPCQLLYEYCRTHRGVLADVRKLRNWQAPSREYGELPGTLFTGYRIAEFWCRHYPEFPGLSYGQIPFSQRRERLVKRGIRLDDDPFLPPPVFAHNPLKFAVACARGEIHCDMSELDQLRYLVLQFDPFQEDRRLARRILALVKERKQELLKSLGEGEAIDNMRKHHAETRGKRWNQSVIAVALKELGILRLFRSFDWNYSAALTHAKAALPGNQGLLYPRIRARWERAWAHSLALMENFEAAWHHLNYPFLTIATRQVDDRFFYRWLARPAESQARSYHRRAELRERLGSQIALFHELV